MTVHVRSARPDDAAFLAEMNQRIAVETEGKRIDDAVLRRGVERGLARPEMCRYFLAERDGVRLGQTMVTYEWSDWRDGPVWWIQSVYVLEEERRSGVFRALHRHVEEQARAAGAVGLRLYVHQDNARAMATYEAMGMERTEYFVYETDWSGALRETGR